MKKILKIVAAVFIVIVVAIVILFQIARYQADVNVTTDGILKMRYGWHIDVKEESKTPIILYQGALVDAKAYLPLAKALSNEQRDVYVIDAPLDLPIFASKQVDKIMVEEQLTEAVVMGHSLGGVVASQVAAGDNRIKGLVLLASYPSKHTDLSHVKFPVLSIRGTEDKVLNQDNWTQALKRLPDSLVIEVIEGGNHAQFGHYGAQKGDGVATISADVQQQMTADKVNAIFK
ncbi:dienelactone hydrolase family protein [Aerococcaceae bacterium zg-ZJ1578]|uniref:alpha/beta family hydrolase n=1 Tax=Aerococcaceae bacterium zg-252 TaxID=2796928 RepID=UPI001A22CB90|nr:dienelactone hydrolase family protein [Aerococcaceae bacterium zg-1578]